MEKRLFEDLIDSGKGDHSTQQSKTIRSPSPSTW
jgi:hypothetical protein